MPPLTDTDDVVLASRALLAVVARTVSPALEQVTLPQFRALVVLTSSGPQPVGTLAGRVGAVVSTFSRTLDRMEAGGWVVRSASPESRRHVLVSPTEKGRDLVEQVTSARRAALQEILDRVQPTQRHEVCEAFRVFADAAGELTADDLLPLGI